jgi:UDP:flavonoid glycosyltransferase YjiC (YdhE family)
VGEIFKVSDLTIEELQEKINQVVKDLENLNQAGESGRKFEVLNEYKKYLEDELHNIKRNH